MTKRSGKWKYVGWTKWEYEIPRVGLGIVRKANDIWSWSIGIYVPSTEGDAIYNTVMGNESDRDSSMGKVEEYLSLKMDISTSTS